MNHRYKTVCVQLHDFFFLFFCGYFFSNSRHHQNLKRQLVKLFLRGEKLGELKGLRSCQLVSVLFLFKYSVFQFVESIISGLLKSWLCRLVANFLGRTANFSATNPSPHKPRKPKNTSPASKLHYFVSPSVAAASLLSISSSVCPCSASGLVPALSQPLVLFCNGLQHPFLTLSPLFCPPALSLSSLFWPCFIMVVTVVLGEWLGMCFIEIDE